MVNNPIADIIKSAEQFIKQVEDGMGLLPEDKEKFKEQMKKEGKDIDLEKLKSQLENLKRKCQ